MYWAMFLFILAVMMTDWSFHVVLRQVTGLQLDWGLVPSGDCTPLMVYIFFNQSCESFLGSLRPKGMGSLQYFPLT